MCDILSIGCRDERRCKKLFFPSEKIDGQKRISVQPPEFREEPERAGENNLKLELIKFLKSQARAQRRSLNSFCT
jgi:hypothetical protein